MKCVRRAAAVAGLLSLAVPAAAGASTGPDPALGNGLGRLVNQRAAAFRTAGPRLDQGRLAIRDKTGRVLVDLTASEGSDLNALRSSAETAGLSVTSVDTDHGTLEGFLALDKVEDVAALNGTGTLAAALKPVTNTGSVTSQGVAFERADKVAGGIDGRGLTVAAMSDSFDTATTTITGDPLTVHAADDYRTGDLSPVTVVQDDDSGTGFDEGRAMLQIVHDVAPQAKLCFGLAGEGLVGFANNVLRLADKHGPCGADVLVDDVVYLDEPFFSDSVMSDAINKVTAAGAHYFSSAGNQGDHGGWASPVRLVNAKQGAAAAHLDFSDVDPSLYSGGLQDMDPGSGTDVAQTVAFGEGGGTIDFQWDDPVDLDGVKLGPAVSLPGGEITAANPEVHNTLPISAAQVGKQFQVNVDAIPSGSTDLILGLADPSGNLLQQVDTGSSPEQLAFTPTVAGDYTVVVTGFAGDTGDFTAQYAEILAPSRVSTDFNLLFFDTDGQFLGAVADNNPLSGRPSEIAGLDGPGDVQMVVARAGSGKVGATRLKSVLFDDAYYAEYSDPLAPTSFGHSQAAGAIGVAAYDPFPPYLPEDFTSPGGDQPIVFDSKGNRYPKVQIRRSPSVAAADGGNTTFFVSDTPRDPDTLPNFFGTSAAAPHAAAIGALVLQKYGPMGVEALRQRLQSSAFPHDLDPDYVSGSANGLTVTASGPQGEEVDPIPTGINDPQFFKVAYNGSVPLKSIEFVGETGNPTGLKPGILFDNRPFDGVSPFDDEGFPFTSTAADVVPSFSKQKAPGQYSRLTLTFKRGLAKGRSFAFGVDRDEATTAVGTPREGNGADILGGATFYPSGVAEPIGLGFIVTRTDGKKFIGALVNRLGSGFTPLDGYGVINAQAATGGSRR